jgi:hypothetical protein
MRTARTIVASVAVIVAAVLLPLAVTAHWSHRSLTDTDRFVATMAPLARDRPFTDELADKLTDRVYRDLPPSVQSAALATSARETLRQALAERMAEPSFQTTWNRATRSAQQGAAQVFTGPEADDQGAVVVDLTPVVVTVVDGVHDPLLAPLVPAVATTIRRQRITVTLLTAAQVHEGRTVFAEVVGAEWPLWVGAAAAAAVALAVAPRRWRVLFGGAVATVATTALAFGALAAARAVAVDRATRLGLDQTLSGNVFDVLDRYLRVDLTITLVVAAAVAVAAGAGAFVRSRQTGRSATAASRSAAAASSSVT